MGVVLTQNGDKAILNKATNGEVFLNYRLFKNNRIPSVTDVLGDYNEADFNGYGLVQPAWSAAFVNAFGKGQVNATSITWVSANGAVPNTIYGVYVESFDTELIYADRFEVPIEVNAAGIVIFYQPVVTAVTE